ncbi:uncharacterized protein SCODWIG_02170 [Saccharomycodes ludwigii]|uniref:Uncharacterized protein n=2 Tax=Saccharomycodes ludwigii TaxID=36035 RepID=A0A376B751_9ASCO|nr:uncharacterized protein SCODWIG_02170 [Saccharomycodes ludwigii]
MDSNTGIPSISKKSQILSTDKEHINDNNGNDNKASEVTNAPLQPLLGKKLEVKDGKNLFVRNTSDFHYNGDGIKYNNNGEVGHGAIFKTLENNLQKDIEIISHKKTGLTGKLNNWLFGWGEL